MHAALFLSLIAENKTVIRGKNVYFIARSVLSALKQIDDMKYKKDNSCLRKQVRAHKKYGVYAGRNRDIRAIVQSNIAFARK
jgi:hypothetical protein